MIHRDARFDQQVTERVRDIESRTDAEVVVVAASRSGSYDRRRYLVTAAITFAALVVLIEIPAYVPPVWVVIDLALTWFATAWILDADPLLSRLVSARAKSAAVARAAAAEFHLEAVHSTPRRLGVLVYVSAFEGEVVLIPDIGVEAVVPAGLWAGAHERFAHDDLEHFLSGLDAVGDVLAEHLPRTDGTRLDLPDAPRIRG